MKQALYLFAIALVFTTKITAHEFISKKDYYEKDYSELIVLGGANFIIPISDNNRGGYSLGMQFLQSHFLGGRFGFIDLLTGLTFQYDCFHNKNAKNCLSKLGVIGSLRFPFYLQPPICAFLELFLDIKPGIAYSAVDIDLASVESKGDGFLVYTTFQVGITSGHGFLGTEIFASAFSIFFSVDTILSKGLKKENIIFLQGINLSWSFRFY